MSVKDYVFDCLSVYVDDFYITKGELEGFVSFLLEEFEGREDKIFDLGFSYYSSVDEVVHYELESMLGGNVSEKSIDLLNQYIFPFLDCDEVLDRIELNTGRWYYRSDYFIIEIY